MMDWFLKLISGWLPIGLNSTGKKKTFGEWVGKIVWVVGIVVGLMFLDKLLTKPQTTTLQAGSTQVVYQGDQRDMMGVGCNFFRAYVKVGVKSK